MSETTEHLEHAEHAQHAAHNPFDRKVAMTMAMVAAVLAIVTMLSHRAHNETLRYQTLANSNHTLAADQWGYYQAKKNRHYLYEGLGELEGDLVAELKPAGAGSSSAKNPGPLPIASWVAVLFAPLPFGPAPLLTALSPERQKPKSGSATHASKWTATIERYRKEAEVLQKQARELEDEAKHAEDESKHYHHRADRYDLGELGVELALVLCSIAVLTKQLGFWLSGIIFGAIGAGVALTGFFLH